MKKVWVLLVFLVIIIVLLWPKKSFMESDVICYDSKTITGLGDRLLDICSVMMQSPESKIHVKWNLGKDQERSTYDTSLIKIENGEISTYEGGSCTKRLDTKFPHRPGTDVPPEDMKEQFRKVASRIKPSQDVENVIPKESYVTIHIRGKDKLTGDVETGDWLLTSKQFFEMAKQKCIEYVQSHPEKTYFVCSDDDPLKTQFIDECGTDIKFINIEYGNLDRAIVDLFVMSRSELVIQCTRYSTFSIVASIIGGIPLLNFDERKIMGREDWNWKPFTISPDEV